MLFCLGTASTLLMSRGNRVNIYFGRDKNFEVQCMQPNGDCFFLAVEASLNNSTIHTSVPRMRQIISNNISEDTLETYKIYHQSGIPGYEFMSRVETLDQLKEIMNESGRDTGPGNCVWADVFAIQTLSNEYNIIFLIINEDTRTSPTVISPENNEDQKRYVILQLTRRGHYNLIGYNKKWCFFENELPPVVEEKFGLKIQREEKPRSRKKRRL